MASVRLTVRRLSFFAFKEARLTQPGNRQGVGANKSFSGKEPAPIFDRQETEKAGRAELGFVAGERPFLPLDELLHVHDRRNLFVRVPPFFKRPIEMGALDA